MSYLTLYTWPNHEINVSVYEDIFKSLQKLLLCTLTEEVNEDILQQNEGVHQRKRLAIQETGSNMEA